MFSSCFLPRPCSRQVIVTAKKILQDYHYNYSFLSHSQSSKGRNKGRQRGRGSKRFIDQIRLRAVAGQGGSGSTSQESVTSRGNKRRPDGGHGGRGGHVILVADPNVQNLRMSRTVVIAESGTNGTSQDRTGRAGKNTVIRIPCGVIVRRVIGKDEDWDPVNLRVLRPEDYDEDDTYDDEEFLGHGSGTNDFHDDEYYDNFHEDEDEEDDDNIDEDEEDEDIIDEDEKYDEGGHNSRSHLRGIFEDSGQEGKNVNVQDDNYDNDTGNDAASLRERVTIMDLDKPGSWCVVARGGRGGRGNCDFYSVHGPLPSSKIVSQRARPGRGDIAFLELELKMIADLGLVGFPNAGKSSFLAAISRASPKIAPYPFTTLHPIIGSIEYRDNKKIKVADIPGLVEGASQGKGRGHDFLKHIERTKALMYIVDSAGTDGRDPVDDFRVLIDELESYPQGELLTRPALVVANKVDLLSEAESSELKFELQKVAEHAGLRFNGNVLGISAGVTGEGLALLSRQIREIVEQGEVDLKEANETSFS
jgi:GTPase